LMDGLVVFGHREPPADFGELGRVEPGAAIAFNSRTSRSTCTTHRVRRTAFDLPPRLRSYRGSA
jgi:hypothetical protein